MAERDLVEDGAVHRDHEPMLDPRFTGEPPASVQARVDAMVTVRFLKQQCGGTEAALYQRMRLRDPAPPSTSTTGLWARGEVSSRKRATKTAYAFDVFGSQFPDYPPTGRTLQTIVRDVAPRPRTLALGHRLRTAPAEVGVDEAGETVVIDTHVRLSPGERFDGAEVISRRESAPDGRQRVVVTITVTALLVLLVAVGGAVLLRSVRAHGSDRPAGPVPEVPSRAAASTSAPRNDAGLPVETEVRLDRGDFCTWRLGSNPIPLVSLTPVTMRIDARCNYPADPDPDTDAGATVYRTASNDDPSQAVGRLADGATFTPRCWVRADRVSDSSSPANVSRIWIRTTSPQGYVPDVNVGGGYTEAQLTGLGLARCPS